MSNTPSFHAAQRLRKVDWRGQAAEDNYTLRHISLISQERDNRIDALLLAQEKRGIDREDRIDALLLAEDLRAGGSDRVGPVACQTSPPYSET